MERENMNKMVAASEWKGYWESLINENTTLREHHNALVEAVTWERECVNIWRWVHGECSTKIIHEFSVTHRKARAEVDRLIVIGIRSKVLKEISFTPPTTMNCVIVLNNL